MGAFQHGATAFELDLTTGVRLRRRKLRGHSEVAYRSLQFLLAVIVVVDVPRPDLVIFLCDPVGGQKGLEAEMLTKDLKRVSLAFLRRFEEPV